MKKKKISLSCHKFKKQSSIMPEVAPASTIVPPSVAKKDADEKFVTELPLGIKLTGGEKLRAQGRTGQGVRVAVIDSGVEMDHPEFNGRVLKQMWFRYGTPLSTDDHGTHVAGTIHMMAPHAEIYDYRVFGEEGWDVDSAISTSIFEACFDGCNVINMSLGGRWPSANIRTAVQYAHSQGVVVVCAAGNEGDGNVLTNERSYPAMWPECINVAAVGKSDGLPVARFSNTNSQVDYAGIGVDVVSLKPFPAGGRHTMSGTSMACPHVCGLIAALLSTPDDKTKVDVDGLRKRLDKFALDIGVPGPDNSTGLGFLTYLSKEEFDSVFEEL